MANFALAAMVPDAEVDAAVDEIEHARLEGRARTRGVDAYSCRGGSRGCLAQGGQITLGQGKADTDGLDLRDCHQAGGVVDAHKIARRHTDCADAAGDWRLELRVPKLQPVRLQNRLICLDRLLGRFVGRGRLIQLLLRRDLLVDQLLLAPQVGLGLRERCVVLCELGLVASNQRLDLAIIQGE